MKGFRNRNMPFFRFLSSDNEIRNLIFIDSAQNHTAIKAIIWQYNKTNLTTESPSLFFYEDLKQAMSENGKSH